MIPKILAIDTSCDDTSAAVTAGVTVLSNIIASQTELHEPYGGVFPTVAKQAHQENIAQTIKVALKRARVHWSDLDAIAVTQGPGLAPALEVGIAQAKQLAIQYKLPLIAVNHIEAHLLSSLAKRRRQSAKPEIMSWVQKMSVVKFPVLGIVVSGGHTEFIKCTQIGQYQRLGFSIDDAVGEALDKVGRMLDLGYPAGPVVEKFAKKGDADRYSVPLPMTDREDFNMSFSGLKTWARNKIEDIEANGGLDKQAVFNFAASFQYGVFRHICYKLNKLLKKEDFQEVWLGGGVAANIKLRQMIRETLKTYNKNRSARLRTVLTVTNRKHGCELYLPSPASPTSPTTSSLKLKTPFSKRLCMDNAAMIGVVAGHRFLQKNFVTDLSQLDRMPRWKLG